MVFNSFSFLLFFAIVLAVHYLKISWTARKVCLIGFSYLFYMAWNPPFVMLLWISTLVDWQAGKKIYASNRKSKKRLWLVISLVANLGLLGFFKYGNFLLDNFVAVLDLLNVSFHPARPDIILPVGISFYTFQSMSYTIDIYRKNMKPWKSFVDFAMYVTFFPQLVAGPIVRARDFLPQCIEPKKASVRQMQWGLFLLVTGLFEKIVLADTLLAPAADTVYSQASQAGFVDAWAGTLAFSSQIFFDFAGYSTCAIGVAMCLGFILPQNFRFPYGSVGFSDFWRRWHISLSTWLRDYLYIPLGGNRKGVARTQINLLLTMLIGGLWHGAAWRFVVWGGLHGLFLVLERGVRKKFGFVRVDESWVLSILLAGLTYAMVCMTWVFFRAQNFHDAYLILGQMFHFNVSSVLETYDLIMVFVISFILFAWHSAMRKHSFEGIVDRAPVSIRAVCICLMLVCISLVPGDDRAFIYFQF